MAAPVRLRSHFVRATPNTTLRPVACLAGARGPGNRVTSVVRSSKPSGESPMPFDLLQRKPTAFVTGPRGGPPPPAALYQGLFLEGTPAELSAAEPVRFGSFTGLGRSMGSGGRSLRAREQPRLSLLVRS